jgi:hypothetical protein
MRDLREPRAVPWWEDRFVLTLDGKPAAGENSFTLLAAYDDPANGGNGDGRIRRLGAA